MQKTTHQHFQALLLSLAALCTVFAMLCGLAGSERVKLPEPDITEVIEKNSKDPDAKAQKKLTKEYTVNLGKMDRNAILIISPNGCLNQVTLNDKHVFGKAGNERKCRRYELRLRDLPTKKRNNMLWVKVNKAKPIRKLGLARHSVTYQSLAVGFGVPMLLALYHLARQRFSSTLIVFRNAKGYVQRIPTYGLILFSALCFVAYRYSQVTVWGDWTGGYNLTADRPFVTRLLVTFFGAYPFVEWFGWSLRRTYMLYEFLCVTGILFVLRHIFSMFVGNRLALIQSLGILIVFCFPYITPYRYNSIFPYDLTAVLFVALGLLLVLKQKWWLLYLVTALGAFNRETAILIPCIAMVMFLGRVPLLHLLGHTLVMCVLFFAIRYGINDYFSGNRGGPFWLRRFDGPIINRNFRWFTANEFRLFVLVAAMGFMPLMWLAFKEYVPECFRRFPIVLWGMFVGLMVVGFIYEQRIYGDIVLLMYVPVVLAMTAWVSDKILPMPASFPPPLPTSWYSPLLRCVDKWGFSVLCGGTMVAFLAYRYRGVLEQWWQGLF